MKHWTSALAGVGLGLAGAQARKRQAKKKAPPVKKNPGAVKWFALGMFTWGLLKAVTMARHMHPHGDCPMCAESQMRAVSHPAHLLKSVVTAPISEELIFRHNLQPLLGQQYAGILFGVAHANPRLGAMGNTLRVLEAGLAGALIYGSAYNHAGVVGSALVHAAHNAGADLGIYLNGRQTISNAKQGPSRWFSLPLTPLVLGNGLGRPLTLRSAR